MRKIKLTVSSAFERT